MMLDFGKYSLAILISYGGTFCLLLVLFLTTFFKSKKIINELDNLEKEKDSDSKKNNFN